jgi:hypothetical protein
MHPDKVDPTWKFIAAEADTIKARLLMSVHNRCHFNSQSIIDRKLHMTGLGNLVRQRGRRIERIRVVLMKLILRDTLVS